MKPNLSAYLIRFFLLLLVSTLSLSGFSLRSGIAAEQNYPNVVFEYGFPYDLACTTLPSGEGITDAQRKELWALLPIFEAEWNKRSESFLGSTVNLLHKSFLRKELIATFVICPTPSMSHPLLLSARLFMPSLAKPGSQPTPQFILMNIIFHEILHRYLADAYAPLLFGGGSALLQKYASEGPTVIMHLHLFAVQRRIYRDLGLTSEWNAVTAWFSRVPDPGYKRSIEIVENEGDVPFLEELGIK